MEKKKKFNIKRHNFPKNVLKFQTFSNTLKLDKTNIYQDIQRYIKISSFYFKVVDILHNSLKTTLQYRTNSDNLRYFENLMTHSYRY
jgi:hypothetical protein